MNYHNITYPDMNNGDGLRVVLWLSACSHHCYNCQNPQTWDVNSGIPFDEKAKDELFRELNKDYISGITFSGGDPLHENNLDGVLKLINEFRLSFPEKTIWLYSGYTWEEVMSKETELKEAKEQLEYAEKYRIGFNYKTNEFLYKESNLSLRRKIISLCNILVDGRYIDSQRDITIPWRGSSNQRVINVQESLKQGEVILHSN